MDEDLLIRQEGRGSKQIKVNKDELHTLIILYVLSKKYNRLMPLSKIYNCRCLRYTNEFQGYDNGQKFDAQPQLL